MHKGARYRDVRVYLVMEFSNEETCQDEIEKAKNTLHYFKEKETLLNLIYDNLGTTITKSDDACRMLKDVNLLVQQARLHFRYLTDPNIAVEDKSIAAELPESLEVNKPAIDAKPSSMPEGPENTTAKTRRTVIAAATSATATAAAAAAAAASVYNEQSNTQPQNQRISKAATRNSRLSMRLISDRRTNVNEHAMTRRGSIAPGVIRRQSRIGRPSTIIRRQSVGQSLGYKSDSVSAKANGPPIVQHRIRHNRDYPRPWLDPPPPRRPRPSIHGSKRSSARERRTSMRQSLPANLPLPALPALPSEERTRRASIGRPVKLDPNPSSRRGSLVPIRGRVSLTPSYHTDLIKRSHTLGGQSRALSRHAQPSRLERVQED